MPYVMDLHLFLSRPIQFNPDDSVSYTMVTMSPNDVHCGAFPRRVLDSELESMRLILASEELQALHKSATNAFKMYSKVRLRWHGDPRLCCLCRVCAVHSAECCVLRKDCLQVVGCVCVRMYACVLCPVYMCVCVRGCTCESVQWVGCVVWWW